MSAECRRPIGWRLQGGKDHASLRYIFTRLHEVCRAMFPECDDALLNYLDEDGQRIEPDYYYPFSLSCW